MNPQLRLVGRPLRRLSVSVIAVLAAMSLTLTAARPASAHGVWGHVHVTGWAIENLPEGELEQFFADEDVFNAAIFGAAFTDSGYAVAGDDSGASRAYSEHTHWEPFIEDYITWVMENDPPPWETRESRMRVAFLMGCASHGLQDEIFDSLFLHQVAEHDDSGQDDADPASDGFLALDGHLRFVPDVYLPVDALLELYADVDPRIDEDVLRGGVRLLTSVYINDGAGLVLAEASGRGYQNVVPWMRENYMEYEIPGSLHSEVAPTGAYIEAIWERLHGRYTDDQLVIHTYPEAPRRLLTHEIDTPDSWVTLVFGKGLAPGSTTPFWLDSAEAEVQFERSGTQWGSSASRLMRLKPQEILVPGGWYSAGFGPGAALVDGTEASAGFDFDFQVACDSADDETCPDLGELPMPSITDPDAPPEGDDAGPGDDAGDPVDVAEPADVAEPIDETDAGSPGAEPETDIEPDNPTPPESGPTDSDGCAVGSGAAGPLWLVGLTWVLWRRRRRGSQQGVAE